MYRANVEGTRAIMSAAARAGVSRIVYTSSVATMGVNKDGSPANEETPSSLGDMIGHYKRSKFMAEEIVRELAAGGLPIVIVNPSTPVGPGDVKPTPTGRLIVDALTGCMPAYVDTGLNVVHVDDVAQGHVLAYDHGTIGRRYVLGGTDMTLRQILSDCRGSVCFFPVRGPRMSSATGRGTRWTPSGTRQRGLARTATSAWRRRNPMKLRPIGSVGRHNSGMLA
jgi:nucleoside-diphosphate-sugar epimerase